MHPRDLLRLRQRRHSTLQGRELGRFERRQDCLQARRTLRVHAAGIVPEAGLVRDEQRCHVT
jgi:hypothetical protein